MKTKKEIIQHLNLNGGNLMGSTRPAAGIQLDRWSISGKIYLVTGKEYWNHNLGSFGGATTKEYNESNILRIEECIELS